MVEPVESPAVLPRAATGAVRTVPERKAIKAALKSAGLSTRQVDALLRAGWKGLVGDTQAHCDDLIERLSRLTTSLETSD